MSQSMKVVVVGDGAVGKTFLLLTLTTGKYPDETSAPSAPASPSPRSRNPSFASIHLPTDYPGPLDYFGMTLPLSDKTSCNVNMWDTNSREDYDRLRCELSCSMRNHGSSGDSL